MFGKIKNLFATAESQSQNPTAVVAAGETASGLSPAVLQQVRKLAKQKKYLFSERAEQRGYVLAGQIAKRPFKMERGQPSREYVQGLELRARCDLGVHPDAGLMIVNRHLKKSLDQNAYTGFSDTMDALAQSHLPEEVLWMTMYGEVAWPELGERFSNDYCILAEDKRLARALVDAPLVQLLSAWPVHSLTRPTMLLLLRGRLYLRMQFDDDSATLAHALEVFSRCGSNIVAKQALLAEQAA